MRSYAYFKRLIATIQMRCTTRSLLQMLTIRTAMRYDDLVTPHISEAKKQDGEFWIKFLKKGKGTKRPASIRIRQKRRSRARPSR